MKKFAVFDIDGTLIRWQLYHATIDKLAKTGALGPDAHTKLHAARMQWKRREHSESFREYEIALINVYETALQKISTQDFDKAVDQVIDEYKDQTYTYTRKLLKDLKAKGYVLLAISGSQQELVQQIAKHYGFDDCVGTTYLREGEVFSGEKVFNHDKRPVLEALVKKHNLDYADSVAVGDSASDARMLEAVEHPIAFNPDRSLFEIATKNRWKIVLERKNVVYELEDRDGRYILL